MTPALFDPAQGGLAALAALHHTSFPDPWDAAAIADLLAGPGVYVFHGSDGFIMARAVGAEAEILTLAVTPAARGRGLGRALLQAAIAHAATLGVESMFLEVGTDNPAALALYAGMGFTPVGKRKAYYVSHAAGSQDALVLRRALSRGEKFP